MRVLYVANSNGMDEGSVIALLSIIEEVKQRGNDVFVVFPSDGEAKAKCEQLGIPTVAVKYWDSIYPKYYTIKSFLAVPYKIVRNWLQNYNAVKKIESVIDEFKPDIVHTNVGTMNVGYYAAKRKKIPHVWHIREIAEKNLGWYPLPTLRYKKKLQNNNDANIAITQDVFDYYGLSKRNSTVVYDGVFTNGCAPEIIYEKEKYFLFVGRIVKGKGTQWATDAFLQIKDRFPDYYLLIAGEGRGDYADAIKEKCKNEIESGRIQFLGYRSDVYSLMQKATALLVPSEREGFGFITAEAMYNGCLVIGRNTGGTKEQFDNGLKTTGYEIGLRFETEKDLEDAMATVCEKGVKRYADMIKRAQDTVVSLYTIENNVNQVVSMYNKLQGGDYL